MIEPRLVPLLLLLMAACAPTGSSSPGSNTSNSIRTGVATPFRVNIAATYNASLLPDHVALAIRNEETFPVCFSSDDLLPGSETTLVRDFGGRVLSGSPNRALEEFRSINLAGPVVVLRPGRTHSELMNFEEYHLGRTSVILQIGFAAFRCSELFDDTTNEVRPTIFQKVFRIARNGITEQPGLQFEVGEEPPRAR